VLGPLGDESENRGQTTFSAFSVEPTKQIERDQENVVCPRFY